jgi:SdpC family antimicrobial peptide
MRSIISSKLVIAMLACGILAVGCMGAEPGTDGAAGDDTALEASALPDGEELYRGMVFGEGPAAKLFPEIWQSSAVQGKVQISEAERRTAADQVVAWIHRKDPTFFDRFGSDMTSGDREAIASILAETRDITVPAVKDVAKLASQKSGRRASPGEDRGLGVYLYADLVVVYDIAVAVVAVAFGFVAVMPADASQGQLQHDAWVDALAKRDMRLPEQP